VLRIVRVGLVVAAVVVAFVLGHVTAPRMAQAQSPQPGSALSDLRCYGAQFGPQAPTQIALHDQFQTSEATVTIPQLFCAPVTTTLRQRAVPVEGVADHLVCYYAPGGTALAQSHTVTNQLGKITVANLVPRMLCVPTHQDT